jgi:hypothetical protein
LFSCLTEFQGRPGSEKIEAAVKKVSDKEARRRNVVVYDVTEKRGEDLLQCIDNILSEIDEKPGYRTTLESDQIRVDLSKLRCQTMSM